MISYEFVKPFYFTGIFFCRKELKHNSKMYNLIITNSYNSIYLLVNNLIGL